MGTSKRRRKQRGTSPRFAWLGAILLVALVIFCAVMLFTNGFSHKVGKDASLATETVTLNQGLSAASMQSASSDVLLVNRQHPLPETYQPEELVNLYAQDRSFQLADSDLYLEKVAFEAANAMFAQAKEDGVEGFILTSGYRSREKQQALYDADTNGTAAAPGQSEHETGLAFDVTAYRDNGGFETTEQFQWICQHCWEYGFILRYPKDKVDVTGFSYEPWHYRYVGKEIAKVIWDRKCTLEEYCANPEA